MAFPATTCPSTTKPPARSNCSASPVSLVRSRKRRRRRVAVDAVAAEATTRTGADGRQHERVRHLESAGGLGRHGGAGGRGTRRRRGLRWSWGNRGGAGGGAALMDFMRPRVILAFPPSAGNVLLSGGVLGAENLQSRPQVIDAPLGKGHVVMFAIRPFWR